ncbi:MAG TPA: diguanylate cyclase [Anaerolineales bacterium]|nr:diguanylate cyclase [Anaerolineales bacterium]
MASQPNLVADTHSNQRFAFVVRYFVYVALGLHALFIPIFYALNVRTLALANIVSVLLYVAAIVVGRRGRYGVGFILCAIEVLGHSVLAVLNLGWESGFQYYIFVMAVIVFLYPSDLTSVKALVAAGMYLTFVTLSLLAQLAPQPGPISTPILRVFEAFNVSTFFFLIIFLTYLYNRAANSAEGQLQDVNRALNDLARTDSLTGLANRRAMTARLDQAVAEATGQRSFAIAICDIDDFKALNDTFGHLCGDQILREASRLLNEAIREQDLIARWGGEEFLIYLPATDLRGAAAVAERMRVQVADTQWECAGVPTRVTLTFGISVHRPGASLDDTISAADQALYAGKHQGKDRVMIAPQVTLTRPPAD